MAQGRGKKSNQGPPDQTATAHVEGEQHTNKSKVEQVEFPTADVFDKKNVLSAEEHLPEPAGWSSTAIGKYVNAENPAAREKAAIRTSVACEKRQSAAAAAAEKKTRSAGQLGDQRKSAAEIGVVDAPDGQLEKLRKFVKHWRKWLHLVLMEAKSIFSDEPTTFEESLQATAKWLEIPVAFVSTAVLLAAFSALVLPLFSSTPVPSAHL